jgi:hypothetical protein
MEIDLRAENFHSPAVDRLRRFCRETSLQPFVNGPDPQVSAGRVIERDFSPLETILCGRKYCHLVEKVSIHRISFATFVIRP